MHWDGGGGGGGGDVQGFQLKLRDYGQLVQGSALSRLASIDISHSSFTGGKEKTHMGTQRLVSDSKSITIEAIIQNKHENIP